jgi:hypothetical protein
MSYEPWDLPEYPIKDNIPHLGEADERPSRRSWPGRVRSLGLDAVETDRLIRDTSEMTPRITARHRVPGSERAQAERRPD